MDRNRDAGDCTATQTASLSARRAWIEIGIVNTVIFSITVALRKESVDRNLWWGVRKAVGSLSLSARRAWIEIADYVEYNYNNNKSLSARRAWIEIHIHAPSRRLCRVALRKESVDRNREQFKYVVQCRKSLSARRAWIEIGRALRQLQSALRRSPQGERG